MFYSFPHGTKAVAIADYDRPYPGPIVVRAGDLVTPDSERTRETDFMGWTWCRGPDGREGWVPDGWIVRDAEGWRMRRDFSAGELSVRKGDHVILEFSESGFVFGRHATGEVGWLPDAVVQLLLSGGSADRDIAEPVAAEQPQKRGI